MGDTAYTDMALDAHTDNTYFVRDKKLHLHRVYASKLRIGYFRQILPDFKSSISSCTRADREARRS